MSPDNGRLYTINTLYTFHDTLLTTKVVFYVYKFITQRSMSRGQHDSLSIFDIVRTTRERKVVENSNLEYRFPKTHVNRGAMSKWRDQRSRTRSRWSRWPGVTKLRSEISHNYWRSGGNEHGLHNWKCCLGKCRGDNLLRSKVNPFTADPVKALRFVAILV